MIDWLRERSRESPGQTALIAPRRDVLLTYRQLDRRIDRLCHRLEELGLGFGDRLGVLTDRSLAALQLILCGFRMGVVGVPLHADHTPGELASALKRIPPLHLVGDRSILRGLEDPPTEGNPHEIESLPLLSPGGASGEIPPYNGPGPGFATHDVALILFTSGTTGRPRPVALSGRNIHHHVRASARRLGRREDDLWLSPLPTHHMGGIAPLLRSVFNGTALLVSSNQPEEIAEITREYDVSCASLVPPMMQDLLDRHPDCPWGTLRFVLLGGGPIPPDLIRRCRSDDVPVCPTYGMTETCSQIATATPEEAGRHPDSVGRPLDGLSLRIVRDGKTVREPAQAGEIVVSGPSVFPGYVNQPDTNREVFSHRGFHTGDHGRLDPEGRLTVLQRREDRIVSGGKNIDPRQIRRELLDHASVVDVAVVGVPHSRWGQTVGVMLRVKPGDEVAREQIETFLRRRVADYKIPRRIEFTDRIPRTVSGTVDRDTVRERLTEPETETP